MECPRYLLLKGTSGFGNRLAAFAEAVVYSRLTGRRLVVDWRDSRYSDSNTNVFPRLFDASRLGSITEFPRDATAAPATWAGFLDRTMERAQAEYEKVHKISGWAEALSIDPSRLDYPETVAVLHSWRFRFERLAVNQDSFPPEWRGLDEQGLQRRVLRDHLNLLPELARQVERFREVHFKPPMIGVHIRQSDNMRPGHLAAKGVSVSAIEELLRRVRRKVPRAGIYLATDNRSVLEWIRKQHPGVAALEKWFPEPGANLHGNKDCPDLLAMAQAAVIELHLLAACDYLVYCSKSSYGEMAVLLSLRPAERNFDAERILPGTFTAEAS